MDEQLPHDILVKLIQREICTYIEETQRNNTACTTAYSFEVNTYNVDCVKADIAVICDSKRLTSQKCTIPPELIIEVVSQSSRYMDFVTKVAVYEKIGVCEYWIVDPVKRNTWVYWFGDDFSLDVFPFDEAIKTRIFSNLLIKFDHLC